VAIDYLQAIVVFTTVPGESTIERFSKK